MAASDPLTARILATAGTALARGDVSMEVLADEAGVGRATLYRRFLTRQALVEGLVEAAIDELSLRIAQADLESVATPVAVERAIRAFLLAAERYPALEAITKTPEQEERFARVIVGPLRAVIERGIAADELKGDVDPQIALHLFGALLAAGISLRAKLGVGAEEAASRIAALFLHGYSA
jgi:TetR/AcrR family transcriptional repressor of mexCD-oprJ operon